MPGGDRTGPEGKGPRTGRALGNCPFTEEERKSYDSVRRGPFCRWASKEGRGFGRGRW